MSIQKRTIEIDFDVHKVIEMERENFSETANDVLRRILKLKPKKAMSAKTAEKTKKSWIHKGVTLPHETLLRAEYNGQIYEGRIVDGRWIVEGKEVVSTPSGALISVAQTKRGKNTNLNGWNYWFVKRPTDVAWIRINSLRSKVNVTLEDLGL